jgi:SAM-dependent methyltransferase
VAPESLGAEQLVSTGVIPEDVPSPIDFHDRAQALEWIERTERERPYRRRFFQRIADELAGLGWPLSVVELGSGPGLLARHILDAGPIVSSYTLIDFSPAMLAISRERLAGTGSDTGAGSGTGSGAGSELRFLRLDFRDWNWADGLGQVDAVVSMQAVHELRHKHKAPKLYRQIAAALDAKGVALICDHLPGPAADARRTALYMTVDEQIAALDAAGLSAGLLLESDGLALYRAVHG